MGRGQGNVQVRWGGGKLHGRSVGDVKTRPKEDGDRLKAKKKGEAWKACERKGSNLASRRGGGRTQSKLEGRGCTYPGAQLLPGV